MLTSPRKKSTLKQFFGLFQRAVSPTAALETDEVKEIKLERFAAKDYFSLVDAKIRDEKKSLHTLSFTPIGLQLIAQYYQEKYQANIIFTGETKPDYAALLKEIRKTREANLRASLVIFEPPPSKHVIPIIYIRENGKEGLLLADSLGVSRDVSDRIAKQTGLTVYAVRHVRQSSDYGCGVDALIFARDCTGKKDDDFIIPNLLTKLETRAAKDAEASYSVKLPDNLLKTSQISSFIGFHKEQDHPLIHKEETLLQFRERYSDKSVTIQSKEKEIKKDSSAGYLRIKAIKLGEVVEMQFYINQLKPYFAENWNDHLRQEFVDLVKSAKQENIHTIAENFLKAKLSEKERIEIVIAP